MSELKPCPFCGTNDWQYQSHFSGATICQCMGCGTIVDESAINARPIEDELRKRIAELEAEVAELKPYRDGYDGYDDYPEEGETVIARLRNWVFLAQHRGDYWYDALGYKEKIRGEVERWWKLPEEVQE